VEINERSGRVEFVLAEGNPDPSAWERLLERAERSVELAGEPGTIIIREARAGGVELVTTSVRVRDAYLAIREM
jgi:hypothetical protein